MRKNLKLLIIVVMKHVTIQVFFIATMAVVMGLCKRLFVSVILLSVTFRSNAIQLEVDNLRLENLCYKMHWEQFFSQASFLSFD